MMLVRRFLLHLGAIAQLGERLAGSEEVVGSNPSGSTFVTQLMLHFGRFSALFLHVIVFGHICHVENLLKSVHKCHNML